MVDYLTVIDVDGVVLDFVEIEGVVGGLAAHYTTLLSKKAGAVFNSETEHMTFVVRKENIEIVGKIKLGLYVVLYLARTGEDKGMLFSNWGRCFGWMIGSKEQLAMISKHCPKY